MIKHSEGYKIKKTAGSSGGDEEKLQAVSFKLQALMFCQKTFY